MATLNSLDLTRYQTAILIRPFRGYTEGEHIETFQKLYAYDMDGKDENLIHIDLWRLLTKVNHIPLLPSLNYEKISDLKRILEDALKEEEEDFTSNLFITVEADFADLRLLFDEIKRESDNVTLIFDLKGKVYQNDGTVSETNLLVSIEREKYFRLYNQAIDLILNNDTIPETYSIGLGVSLYGEEEYRSHQDVPTLILHDYKLNLYGIG